MEVTPSKPDVVVAVDIEKIGCKLKLPVVSVGFIVGTSEGKLLEKTRISLGSGDYSQWQDDVEFQRCKTEFWDKQPGLLETFHKESVPISTGLAQIAAYVDSLYQRFKIQRWLSDNPAFDLGHLDHQLAQVREYPIRHAPDGEYHSVVDPTEQIKGLPPLYQRDINAKMADFWKGRVKHMPDDDAEGIWWQYVLVKRARDQLKEGPLVAVDVHKRFQQESPQVQNACKHYLRTFLAEVDHPDNSKDGGVCFDCQYAAQDPVQYMASFLVRDLLAVTGCAVGVVNRQRRDGFGEFAFSVKLGDDLSSIRQLLAA